MSILFLVATPIGNLEDISARALRILGEVSLIAAEDTRRTRTLLNRHQIATPLTSYHEHNKAKKIPRLLAALEDGDVALVSDAGTPALNDPGYDLTRAALEAGHQVSPIPGPSAPIAALVASGLPTDKFLYLGYLPRQSGARRSALQEVASLPYTLIFLETPHRLLATLEALEAVLGDRPLAIGRELTKIHEEFFRGSTSQAREYFEKSAPRGEFTLIVAGNPDSASERWSEAQVREVLATRLEDSASASQVAKQVAREAGWPKGEVYRLLLEVSGTDPGV